MIKIERRDGEKEGREKKNINSRVLIIRDLDFAWSSEEILPLLT